MTISFIIPSYQCKTVLDETVALILQANMPVAEILLIDDGSTDGTAELCDRLAQNEPLVRCIHKKNGGVSSARNLGIEAATGDYIWFVDSDDDIRPIPAAVLEDCEKSAPGMVLFGMEFDYYRDDRRLKTETMRMHIFVKEERANFEGELETKGRRTLEYVRAEGQKYGIDIDTFLLKGRMTPIVMQAVRELNADLLVISGWHNASTRKDTSSVEYQLLLDEAECPVIVVK